MSFSVAEQQTRDTTATNSPCPNKILRIASLHTVLTFEVNDENYSYKYNIEISVFSVFICRYSVFFGISNTDVGIGILKYLPRYRYRYTDPPLMKCKLILHALQI
jgi:hypothetical protein